MDVLATADNFAEAKADVISIGLIAAAAGGSEARIGDGADSLAVLGASSRSTACRASSRSRPSR